MHLYSLIWADNSACRDTVYVRGNVWICFGWIFQEIDNYNSDYSKSFFRKVIQNESMVNYANECEFRWHLHIFICIRINWIGHVKCYFVENHHRSIKYSVPFIYFGNPTTNSCHATVWLDSNSWSIRIFHWLVDWSLALAMFSLAISPFHFNLI